MNLTTKKQTTMEMIPCFKCNRDMPKLRKTKFGYNFCVHCSDQYGLIGKKRAITVQKGEGDHTWNETVIMSEEEFRRYERQEELNNKLLGISKETFSVFVSFDDSPKITNLVNNLPKDPKTF